MCDLNATELASGKIRHLVRVLNLSGSGEKGLSTEKAIRSDMKTEHATREDWKGYTRHVTKHENQHSENDKIFPKTIDRIISFGE
jgi:hypothetical protein